MLKVASRGLPFIFFSFGFFFATWKENYPIQLQMCNWRKKWDYLSGSKGIFFQDFTAE